MAAVKRLRCLFALPLLVGGCSPPSVHYLISVTPSSIRTRMIHVQIDVEHAGPAPFILKGYADHEILKISNIHATRGGHATTVRVAFDSLMRMDRLALIPRVELADPLPGSLTVEYDVEVGHEEGSLHLGTTGRRYGILTNNILYTTGRSILLVPEPASDIAQISVHCSMPPGWSPSLPWELRKGAWWPGVSGRYAAEAILAAPIALGAFVEDTVQIRRTRFRFAFPATVAATERDSTRVKLARMAAYIQDRFPDDQPAEYLTVAMNDALTGASVLSASWALGQGDNLIPTTFERAHSFSRNLADVYLRYPPFRREVKSDDDLWLVDGLTNLFAWRALAHGGFLTPDEALREMAIRYAMGLGLPGINLNMEALYTAKGPRTYEPTNVAPFLLEYIDYRLLRRNPRASLESVLSPVLRSRGTFSFWPSISPPSLRDSLEAFVRGAAAIPVQEVSPMAPTLPRPLRLGPATRRLTLAYTANTDGYLENCGCKVNQAGGYARRASVIAHLRQMNPPIVVLDAGSCFIRPEGMRSADRLADQEEHLALNLMDAMKYDAASIGVNELSFGLDSMRRELRGIATPFLCSNVVGANGPIARPSVIVERDGLRLGVVGVLEQPLGFRSTPHFDRNTADLSFGDPVALVGAQVLQLRPTVDMVIVIGRLAPLVIRKLVRQYPDIDVVVSADDDAPSSDVNKPGFALMRRDSSGFIGNTLIAYASQGRYGMGSAALELDDRKRICGATVVHKRLTPDIPDNGATRDRLTQFYERIGRGEAAQASVLPLFPEDRDRMEREYVGADVCASCHAPEFRQWKDTQHATAYKTLLDVHRHYQPRCVVCHVVGFGTRTGFRVGEQTERLANVQCEVCHGPGEMHIKNPGTGTIRRTTSEAVCTTCHNAEHSDRFVYTERLARIVHTAPPLASAHLGH